MSVIDRSQDARQSVGPIGKRRRLAVWTSRRGTHLGSGHVRPLQQTGHMIASDRIHTNKLLQPGGRPHMGPCFRRDDAAIEIDRRVGKATGSRAARPMTGSARAGTHNHRLYWLHELEPQLGVTRNIGGYGSLAFAGTTGTALPAISSPAGTRWLRAAWRRPPARSWRSACNSPTDISIPRASSPRTDRPG